MALKHQHERLEQDEFEGLDTRLTQLAASLAFLTDLTVWANNEVKIIWGRINTAGSGTILHPASPDFSIVRNGAGDVTVTYNTAFSSTAGVLAVGGIFVAVGSGGNISASSVRLVAAADTTLNFLAIGPR